MILDEAKDTPEACADSLCRFVQRYAARVKRSWQVTPPATGDTVEEKR